MQKFLIQKLILAAAASAAALPALAGAVAEPFDYPESLVTGLPVTGEPATTGIEIGQDRVTLEETSIRELASRHHFPLMREGAGDYTRDWTCLRTDAKHGGFSIWLVASGSPAVTEVQMAASSVPRGKGDCVLLSESALPVSIGGTAPGMTEKDVFSKLGKPTYAAGDGWYFWSTRRSVEEISSSRVRMNWTGVQMKNGRAERIFSSQVTSP